MSDWSGNSNSIWKTIGASNHTEKEREPNEFYATSPIAIDKLAKAFDIPHKVWEPACGGGHLARRLEELGHEVVATDLVYRGYGIGSVDFLMTRDAPLGTDCILTNPPYKMSTEFVEHALRLMGDKPVVMLLKTQALEGKSRFERLYRNGWLHEVYQFKERLLCAKNGEFERMREGGGSAVAYAWYVFRGVPSENTIVKWI